MSAVGAFQWKGGYQEYNSGVPSDFQKGNSNDSYLGKNPLKTQPKQPKGLNHPYMVISLNCCYKVMKI